MTESLESQIDLGGTRPSEGAPSTGSAMQPLGMTLTIFGFVLIAFGLWIYNPTVGSSYSEGTYNIGLLNRQLGIVILGATSSVVGSVLYAGARILETIKPGK